MERGCAPFPAGRNSLGMKRGEMEYCPFCGSSELQPDDVKARVPESYYDCPNCGVIGTLGVGYAPTQVDQ